MIPTTTKWCAVCDHKHYWDALGIRAMNTQHESKPVGPTNIHKVASTSHHPSHLQYDLRQSTLNRFKIFKVQFTWFDPGSIEACILNKEPSCPRDVPARRKPGKSPSSASRCVWACATSRSQASEALGDLLWICPPWILGNHLEMGHWSHCCHCSWLVYFSARQSKLLGFPNKNQPSFTDLGLTKRSILTHHAGHSTEENSKVTTTTRSRSKVEICRVNKW